MWTLLLAVASVWTVLAVVGAVFVGRGIRLADERASGAGAEPVLTTAALALPRGGSATRYV